MYIPGVSHSMNEELNKSQMQEFNAKYEGYADRSYGYMGLRNAISMQEFITILNSIREWNAGTDNEKINLRVINHTRINIDVYINNPNMQLEKLLSETENPERYYFTFKTEDIQYETNFGRIREIKMEMFKIN